MELRLLVVVMLNKKKKFESISNLINCILLFQDKDEEGSDNKQKPATKKKKKEIDLPITPRVPGATKPEMDRLIEQEVRHSFHSHPRKLFSSSLK